MRTLPLFSPARPASQGHFKYCIFPGVFRPILECQGERGQKVSQVTVANTHQVLGQDHTLNPLYKCVCVFMHTRASECAHFTVYAEARGQCYGFSFPSTIFETRPPIARRVNLKQAHELLGTPSLLPILTQEPWDYRHILWHLWLLRSKLRFLCLA